MKTLREQDRKAALTWHKKRKSQPKKKRSIPSGWAMGNRRNILAKENKAEDRIAEILTGCGHDVIREFICVADGKDRFVDFVVKINDAVVGIEIDGGQHMTTKGQGADRKREAALMKSGEITSFVRLSWRVALMHDQADVMAMVLFASHHRGSVVLRY